MEDKEAIEILTAMLKKSSLSKEEDEAIRHSIGILGWTKLMEGWKEQRKKTRERRMNDL